MLELGEQVDSKGLGLLLESVREERSLDVYRLGLTLPKKLEGHSLAVLEGNTTI